MQRSVYTLLLGAVLLMTACNACTLLDTISKNGGSEVDMIESTAEPIEHTLFNDILTEYVSEAGYVDYNGLEENRGKLDEYIKLLQNNAPNPDKWSEDERLAYWINVYNAHALKIVIDNLPVESIKDAEEDIWNHKHIRIADETYSFNNVEHNLIRPRFKEPLIHFGVNCASMSCPSLRNEAYTGDRVREQLAEQARYFLNESGKNRLSTNSAELSKIFDWYKRDFGGSKAERLEYINQYASTKVNTDASVSYMDYDWSLNSQENYKKATAGR